MIGGEKKKKYLDKYRAKFKSKEETVYMVSLDQMAEVNSSLVLPDGKINLKKEEGSPSEGFLGFAINRIQLRFVSFFLFLF
jgi:hypothetical protein